MMADAMAISRSALDVEWQRLQIIAQNLANVNTSRTASGEPYRAMRLVSGPDSSFAASLARIGPPCRCPAAPRRPGRHPTRAAPHCPAP